MLISKPFFSIIIPTYNRAHIIDRAIKSVLNQEFQNWELIIVDDGSKDNTKEVIAQFNDKRIHCIYQENSERSVARNNGIKNAKGEWICFLDSDDEYLPNHLNVIHKEISSRNNAVTLYFTGRLITDNNTVEKYAFLNTSGNILKEIWDKFITMNSSCFHRSILENNKLNSNYRLWEDTHLFLRVAAQYPLIQIKEYTNNQNITDDSTVKIGFEKIKMKDVNQYIHAIKDLQINYSNLFDGKLSPNDFLIYVDSKYQMYLYQARQNKQLNIAFQIWLKAINHRPSFYLLSEFPKIFLNKINIGIHAK